MVGICYAQSAEEYYKKGIEYGVAGKFEKAQQEFGKALEVDPLYWLAKEGLEVIKDVLEQKIKTETALHLFKGAVYNTEKMYNEVIAEFKQAIKINSNYPKAYYVLGLAYDEKNLYDEAIVAFNKAIEINSNYIEAHTNLGFAYGMKEMYDEAMAEFKKALEINPNYGQAHYGLAVMYLFVKKENLAVKHCDEAIKLGIKVSPMLLEVLKLYR